jgi:Carbon-nitrogen hydrolase
VFAPAQWGEHAEGRRTYGHSLIIDPWGEVLADAGEGVGIVSARIDLAAIAKARRMVPSLQHDRPFTKPELAARSPIEESLSTASPSIISFVQRSTRSGVEVDTPCILLNDGVVLDRWSREVIEFLSATIFPLGAR